MIIQGNNFRLVTSQNAEAALATFMLFAPAIGAPPPRQRRRNGKLMPEAVKEKMGKAQTRRHAARLGIPLAEMGTYRRLRRSKNLTQAEALHVLSQERQARRRGGRS